MAAVVTETGRIQRPSQAFHERLDLALVAGGSVTCDHLTRIPCAFLAKDRAAPSVHLVDAPPRLVLAMELLGLAKVYGIPGDEPLRRLAQELPFRVTLVADGTLHLAMQPIGGYHPRINQSLAHEWMEALVPESVEADLSCVQHLTSVLIAWMLQLVQSTRPVPFRVSGARGTVGVQIRQLRLDHLLTIV